MCCIVVASLDSHHNCHHHHHHHNHHNHHHLVHHLVFHLHLIMSTSKKKKNYGRCRIEEDIVEFMLKSIEHDPDSFNTRRFELGQIELKIGKHTIRRVWIHYLKYGEYPYETKSTLARLKRLGKNSNIMNNEHKNILKSIVDEHPEFYLDEFVKEMLQRTGYVFSIPTIHRRLKEIGYSLQVCYLIRSAM